MPGELLAKIYGLYGPRLLEQNVRTFLQASDQGQQRNHRDNLSDTRDVLRLQQWPYGDCI